MSEPETETQTEAVGIITMKPALMVSSSIARVGGMRQSKENEHVELDGAHEVKRWTAIRDVTDRNDLKAADAVASECRRMLRQVCVGTAFGLVCPMDRKQELTEIIGQIRARLTEANKTLNTCHLTSMFVTGTIVSDDKEAAEALTAQLGGFLGGLSAALEACDVKKIRQTLASMKGIETLLPPIQSAAINKAMAAARKAAAFIRHEVEKKDRSITAVRMELDLSELDVARAMFVEVGDIKAPVLDREDLESAQQLVGVEL